MAKAPATQLQVGEREVRVSSPDRILFEATATTPALTKLDICSYFASISEVLMAGIGERPTALERWPGGYREGMT